MNGRQRRAERRRHFTQKIHHMCADAEASGKPLVIYGLTDACRDCNATGSLARLPGGQILASIFHDPHCPAAAGVVEWKPAAL